MSRLIVKNLPKVSIIGSHNTNLIKVFFNGFFLFLDN